MDMHKEKEDKTVHVLHVFACKVVRRVFVSFVGMWLFYFYA